MKTTLRLLALVASLVCGVLRAQDVAADYARAQETYTKRLAEIEAKVKTNSRELLNRFILALVRVEQNYREAGHLDGLVISRQLRERLLQDPVYPEIEERFPDELKSMIATLLQQREEVRRQGQRELDELNRAFLAALDRFQREFTRLGDIEKAVEIREMRSVLQAAVGSSPATAPTPPPVFPVPNDPNVFPLALEPRGYEGRQGLTPRQSQIPIQAEVDDPVHAQVRPAFFALRGGQIRVPAEASVAIVQQAQQNQMLNLELGVQSLVSSQGSRESPATMLVFGNSLADCNLAILQERGNYILLLRTTLPPQGATHHRVNLGPAEAGRAHHIQITYRSGELTVYRNGSETQRIRSTVTGLLTNWTPAPIYLGRLPVADNAPATTPWHGNLVQFYLKSTLDTARTAATNFNRFSTYLSR